MYSDADTRLSLQPAYLLTDDPVRGEVAVPGLALSVDDLGVCVIKSDGSLVAVLPWEEMADLSVIGRTITPEGEVGLIIEAASEGRAHRFVVPTNDPDGIEAALSELPKGRETADRKRHVSPALLAVLFLAVAAAVVVAVLSSMGTLKF